MTTTTQTISFYVPRMRAHWTEQQIFNAMRETIGVVDRVDFGDFVPLDQTSIRCAFIHMAWVNYDWQEWLEREIAANGHCKFQVTYDEYWMLLPNKNPIPKTHLNVHQLAEITRKQDERIEELEALVSRLTEQLENRTEPPRLERSVRTISMGSDSLDDFRANLDQDFLQEAIDSFREQEMERLYRSWQEAEEGEEDEYADMPELIDIDSDSESDNEGSTGSDRMKISEELCGNN
jgi:hypothetical protein